MAPVNRLAPRAPDGCPSTITGGAIAGIVIGSIAGTLLVLWLWRLFSLPGAFSGGREPDVGYRPPVTRSGRRRRSREPRVDYIEKPRRSSSRRHRDEYYTDDVRRPAKIYVTE